MSFSPMKIQQREADMGDSCTVSFEPHGCQKDENSSAVLGLPSSTGNDVPGAVLSAHDISYSVNVQQRCRRGVGKKQILSNITGLFKPGLNAILGATGAGKTMFLNAIADRLDRRGVEGTILLNGKAIPENFKCMVGYVVQDDIVMGTLTVRENLAFSAVLRLPSSISKSEREERIETVIKELGLQDCADTKIGTPFLRGVSGGEKRRCNIGMELLISPPVLFLDEPTSGLDASTASTVLMFLKRLSEKGRTIIFSIHQPRYTIYSLFDNLMLLSEGQTVFHGNSNEALDFFETQGFKCQEHNNPPDFFLDVINAHEATLLEVCTTKSNSSLDDLSDFTAIHDKLIKGFRESDWHKRLIQEATEISYRLDKKGAHMTKTVDRIGYTTSFFNQFVVLSGRTMKDIIRNPQIGLTVIISSLFLSLIIATVFWQIDKDPITGFTDRSGVLLMAMLIQFFYCIAAMDTTAREKVVVVHENTNGFYRMSVYCFVKIFVDIIPMRLLTIVPMSTITYFGVGMRTDAFWDFVLILFNMSVSTSALFLFVIFLVETFAAGQIIASVTLLTMLLFSGCFINLGSSADLVSWLQYGSFVRYGAWALYVNEFKDTVYCAGGDNGTFCKSGNLFLTEIGVDYETPWDFWHNHVALTVFTIIFFLLSYVQLRKRRVSG